MKVENLLALFSQFAASQGSATLWSMARLADNNALNSRTDGISGKWWRKGQAVILVSLSGVTLPQILLSGGKSAVKPPKALQIFLGLAAETTSNATGKYPIPLAWWLCKGCLRERELPLDSPSYVPVLC